MTLITTHFGDPSSLSYAVSMVTLNDRSRLSELTSKEKEIFDKKNLEELKLSFLAGRVAAHEAMAAVGEVNEVLSLESTTQRAPPLWPPNISGSIAHTKTTDLTIGVVVVSRQLQLFGIDIEPLSRRISDSLSRRVLNDKEAEKKSFSDDILLKIFCIKEAAYKALWPVVKQPMSFQEVTVDVEQKILILEERLKIRAPSYSQLYYQQITFQEMLITLVSSTRLA
jgi:4'-phosphopantetheinyl transferase EntD